MAFKTLTILEKQIGTSTEIAVRSSRIGTPILIQPDYTLDVSYLNGIYIQSVSTGYGLSWNQITHKLDVDGSTGTIYYISDVSTLLALAQYDIQIYFYTKPEVDSLLDAIIGGTY